MNLNNRYNFKNTVRHFLNIDNAILPKDISTFDIKEICWTEPITFRIKKEDDKFRTLKIPNILNFTRAIYYYENLQDFYDIKNLDPDHKRLTVNLETGDFVAGEYDKQLNDDFNRLCLFDHLLKVDIKEYYGKIYTHYLDCSNLDDMVLAGLNNGRTAGLLMGNYLSLYFAELLLSKISIEIENEFRQNKINCEFMYFSDDFYFFCNKNDIGRILIQFDSILEKYEFERKESKKELWDYETYNSYNILTRYWKSTIKHWNLEVLKDYKIEKDKGVKVKHKLVFLNQLIYRISTLSDEKSKRVFVNNFFKTKHFQKEKFSKYEINNYNYHQLCFLFKLSPEILLYTPRAIKSISNFNGNKIKKFFELRYREVLLSPLHDEQLYYYYAIKCFEFDSILKANTQNVIKSENQVLISYYLMDSIFTNDEINELKLQEDDKYWFQNYHLILFSKDLRAQIDANITKYLIPKRTNKNKVKTRYLEFYKENLSSNVILVENITSISIKVDEYLSLRHNESTTGFA